MFFLSCCNAAADRDQPVETRQLRVRVRDPVISLCGLLPQRSASRSAGNAPFVAGPKLAPALTEQQGSTFPHVVLELLAEQRLPVVDVLRLERVSRACRERLGGVLLAEPIRVNGRTKQHRASAVAWLARNLQRTRDLEFCFWRAAVPPRLLTRANSLVRLSFDEILNAPELPSLAACTALKELKVIGCTTITRLPPLDALSQLTRLEVVACSRLTHLPSLTSSALQELRLYGNNQLQSLPSGLVSFTALKALDLSNGDYNSFPLPQDVLPALAGLTQLALSGCQAETLPTFDSFPHLAVLRLGNCDVTASQLLTLTACTRLDELSVSECVHQGGGFYVGAPLPPLAAVPSLRRLHLSDYLCDVEFPSLAGLTGLTSLVVSACLYMMSTQLLAPLSGLTSLVHLDLAYCHCLTQLPSLAACMQLKRLHVSSCNELAALPDLSGCVRLEELTCCNCTGLESVPDLTTCTALKSVSFRNCRKLAVQHEWVDRLRSCGVLVQPPGLGS